jgi:hypothetical protein
VSSWAYWHSFLCFCVGFLGRWVGDLIGIGCYLSSRLAVDDVYPLLHELMKAVKTITDRDGEYAFQAINSTSTRHRRAAHPHPTHCAPL